MKTNSGPQLTIPNGHAPNSLSPGAAGSSKRVNGQGTPVKRKAIPAQLFEEAGIDPAQSPYASKESLGKHSNPSLAKLPRTASASALSTKSGSGSLPKTANGTSVSPKDEVPPTPPIPSILAKDSEAVPNPKDASTRPEAAVVPTVA